MKFTIRVDEGGKILAINRWRPIIKKQGKKTSISYDIPNGLHEISKDKYSQLCARKDLGYIKWIDGEVVEESEDAKAIRLARNVEILNENKLRKLKNLLSELSDYVMLTPKGKDLIK